MGKSSSGVIKRGEIQNLVSIENHLDIDEAFKREIIDLKNLNDGFSIFHV